MRQEQETPSWITELNLARNSLRDELQKSLHEVSDGLFAAIDRFVQAKIEASKRNFF